MTRSACLGGDDRGSTIPLIVGFFVLALLVVAGSIAAGDAAIDQQGLQSLCDSASLAVVRPDLADLRETGKPDKALSQSSTDTALDAYIRRDPERQSVDFHITIAPDQSSLMLHCSEEIPVAMGWLFGRSSVRHNAYSPADAPTTT
ncbi:putative Flp pilus-assembly TadE/G-like protein [Jatrophihabitans sp. GAS493]|uniref:Tad domain-containing protein n=1 Tax=Jatrophihabitans sp. GAS493 TaxID=1907575 RepID=UPI000BB99AA1|nr:Tad domain-containing protein [Jatrophihabitans sp. GAS493]SOD74744.1 putative Flp pilus-assembly TadE/G-like protein [Jatrophihabitans sp. GAS493]